MRLCGRTSRACEQRFCALDCAANTRSIIIDVIMLIACRLTVYMLIVCMLICMHVDSMHVDSMHVGSVDSMLDSMQ